MDPTTILERENLNATGAEARQEDQPSPGWLKAGAGLGDAISGASTMEGNPAYTRGMQVGAQTMDALAQARQRVNESNQAHQAATTLRNPQVQQTLGIKPEEGELAAVYAEKGVPPEQITQMLQGFQHLRLGNALADTSQPLDVRHGAAFALAPASAAPKAEGPLGSAFDPLANGGSGQTAVSPLQAQVAQSEIAQHKAGASEQASLAGLHQVQATNANAMPTLPKGYKFATDPQDPSGVLHDAQGKPVMVPDPAAGAGGKESAVNARYNQNMLGAAAGASRELQNVSAIGPTTSAGLTGFGGTGHGAGGVLHTLSDNLGRTLSTTDQQEFHKSMQNIGRFVGIIENGGRATTAGAAGSAQAAIESQAGDTESSRLYGLAIARQQIEAQADRIHASGTTQAVQDAYDKEVKAIQKAIPFTPIDVINFGRAGKGTKFTDYLSQHGEDKAAAAPAAAGGAIDMGGGWSVKVH